MLKLFALREYFPIIHIYMPICWLLMNIDVGRSSEIRISSTEILHNYSDYCNCNLNIAHVSGAQDECTRIITAEPKKLENDR